MTIKTKYISMGECNTIVSAYTLLCIGTYNSIALTHRYGRREHQENAVSNLWK